MGLSVRRAEPQDAPAGGRGRFSGMLSRWSSNTLCFRSSLARRPTSSRPSPKPRRSSPPCLASYVSRFSRCLERPNTPLPPTSEHLGRVS